MSGTKPTPGVTITLTGDASDSVVTDANGEFSFDLPDGSYVLTPSKDGHQFTPASANVEVSGADDTGNDFTAEGVYTISGTITGDEDEGVTVALTGDATDSTTTAADGTYSFTGVVDGSYTVTPTLDGYVFTDASENVSVSGGDVSVDNMVGVLTYVSGLPYYIDGGWEDGSTPTFGAQPANDWSKAETSATTFSNTNVITLMAYTPTQSKMISGSMPGSALEGDYVGIRYHGFSNDSLVFDKSKGIRVMALASRSASATTTKLNFYLGNAALTSWFRADWSNTQNPDLVQIREYFNGGAYDNTTSSTITDTTGSDERWCAVGIELPANLSGNASAVIKTLGTGGATKTLERAIVSDWSSVDIVEFRFDVFHHGSGNMNVAWLWIGTADDDWPV